MARIARKPGTPRVLNVVPSTNTGSDWSLAVGLAAGALKTAKLPATVAGGHAICIVGYRPDGRFIVRNSWGTAWGDKGFAYVSPGYIQAAFFDESYVMTL